MLRRTKLEPLTGKVILLVDDNLDYLQVTRALLEREGHTVISAMNGPEALALLRQRHVDLLLLDYYMPGMTGEELVTQLRQFNPYVQVILQTGYASEQPPRQMLRQLDIQGYYDKTEGPAKLLLWTEVGLKAAHTVQLLDHSRQGLRYILDVTPELHKIQPLEDLWQGILWQVTGLLGVVNSFLAVLPENRHLIPATADDSFLAMVEDESELIIRAATGQFATRAKVVDCLESGPLALVRKALQEGQVQTQSSMTVVPLQVGNTATGIIYLERATSIERETEMVQIFANQAAVAIRNSQLYEMAAFDPLTGVYVRRFFGQLLLREIRSAFRSQQPTALLMMDLDGLKRLNDTAGHLVGDQALALMGKVLRRATRASDVVGRYAGDEFVVLLPNTGLEGAERVGQRVLEALSGQRVPSPMGGLPVQTSIGLALLEPYTISLANVPHPISQSYFEKMSMVLIRHADEALYKAKAGGRNQLCINDSLPWRPLDAVAPNAND